MRIVISLRGVPYALVVQQWIDVMQTSTAVAVVRHHVVLNLLAEIGLDRIHAVVE